MATTASSSAAGAASGSKQLDPQQIQVQFQRYRTELQSLAQKIGELESEMEEHALVLSTLKPLVTSDPERKCFRLIGGVLVQRTVKDVVPALETNYAGIKEVLETLVKTYKGKEEEFASFQREHKIVVSMSTIGGTAGARLLRIAHAGSGSSPAVGLVSEREQRP
ncbi:prefoldin subunit 2 [Trichosporon asahii var. asahii CBS 2479]|uniref:Prefoldin subunit 2 n=1 Tax=Trichosporon asahii var. asahii (strain ATCC 90039 / CBS 2479 / JCM 2466 / KCTC 7840 / NBRC 103889/ NCYC 2677 / UAMH 7654) TaxID=1186058 RepID=J6F061_TRIAS|nr:prefoldin subunit 2 [Trichosporon asahii var. asahii CBS 2479]EJT50324.1 prefoldin subunit 2 [Trichosporon asahii var. asahii CBS 2479]